MSLDDIRVVLRALAEVRDKEFYDLWLNAIRSWPEPLPEIEFRIYQVANSDDVHVVVLVEGTRPDGTEFNWGLTVTTRNDRLIIGGSIGRRGTDDDGSEVFRMTEETSDPLQAASIIRAVASEVCNHREWLSQP